MTTDLTPVRDAPAGPNQREFHALKSASNEAPRVSSLGSKARPTGAKPSAWVHLHVQLPEAANDPSEDAISIDATYACARPFRR